MGRIMLGVAVLSVVPLMALAQEMLTLKQAERLFVERSRELLLAQKAVERCSQLKGKEDPLQYISAGIAYLCHSYFSRTIYKLYSPAGFEPTLQAIPLL